jgi:hypothetical protein
LAKIVPLFVVSSPVLPAAPAYAQFTSGLKLVEVFLLRCALFRGASADASWHAIDVAVNPPGARWCSVVARLQSV